MPRANLIIVEDETIVARDLETRLKNLDYKVLAIVSSGDEAIDAAGKYRPDIMLMDILLKGNIDGIRTAAEIKRLYNIPSIYLTSYSDDYIISRAKATEPFGYILKPFSDREVHINIEIALYRNRVEKEKAYNFAVKSMHFFNLSILSEIECIISGPKQDFAKSLDETAKIIKSFNNLIGPDEGRTNLRLYTLLENVISGLEPKMKRCGFNIDLHCSHTLEITASKKILELSFFILFNTLLSITNNIKVSEPEIKISVEKTDIGASVEIKGEYSLNHSGANLNSDLMSDGVALAKYFIENNNESSLFFDSRENSFECTIMLM